MNQKPITTQEESAIMDGVLSQHHKRFEAGAADETRDCGGEPQTALGGGNTEAGMAQDVRKASGAPLSNPAPENYLTTLSQEPEPEEPPDQEVPRNTGGKF